jgi:4-amino-4-deoxy-L-arabinose transferase-like glycosyltransferase
MLATGDFLVPRLGGEPWLEKPPLETWLIALAAYFGGGVSELTARVPSVGAAILVALAVVVLGNRHNGPKVGALAGTIQATTLWFVMRGRLAEVDMPLAALTTWALVAVDAMRIESGEPARIKQWQWLFWGLLGATALAKGIGFGAALIASVVVLAFFFEPDLRWLRFCWFPPGWILAACIGLAWPMVIAVRYPGAVALWMNQFADRLAARPAQFMGEPLWEYLLAPFWQTLPWTPLALAGAWGSFVRSFTRSGGPDRFLGAWAVGPALVVSLATVKNAHYLIYALPPWSIWAAQRVAQLQMRLALRGWSPTRIRCVTALVPLSFALCYGAGFLWLGPRFDRRGQEWAFYEAAGKQLRLQEPVELLYAPDDHFYRGVSGPAPHDLGVRLFYLNHSARVRVGFEALAQGVGARPEFSIIARRDDATALRKLGRVEMLASGPTTRADRSYALFRVTTEMAARPQQARTRSSATVR